MTLLLQATEVREEFDWIYLPAPWVIFLIVVPLVVLLVAAVYRRERLAGNHWARWPLVALRVAVILAILAFLAQPVLRTVTYQTRDPQLIVLVDDSLSMGIVDKFSNREIPARVAEMLDTSPEVIEQITRYGLVDRLLGRVDGSGGGEGASLLAQLRKKMNVSVYTFAGSARKIAEIPREGRRRGEGDVIFTGLPDLDRVQADARVKETKIGDSVLETLLDHRGDALAPQDHGVVAVVLFTDGQNNSGVLQPEEMAFKIKQRGIPLLVVGLGNPDPPKNIRVVGLDVDDVVLVGDEVSFDASIVTEGFRGENVQVDLLVGNELVDRDYVSLEADGVKQTVRLEYTPKRPGDFTVTVQVEKLGGELFWDDNTFSRSVKVLDQKIKVLYVEGPPRWEYRYLKNALIRDPTMEARILLLSADRKFRQETSEGLEPLVQFPATEQELFEYHVLIIGDVEPGLQDPSGRPFRDNLELIQRFVGDSGGGVVFIAGPRANPQGYLHTPLYPLLPVEIAESGTDFSKRIITDRFHVELTGAGKQHPVMRLDSDADRNSQLWENTDGVVENHLPGFYWFAEVKKAKLAAIPLAVHEDLSHPVHGRRVIFAVQNYSKGKVFYSGVDNTWRWRAGVDNLYFYRFWGQVIRWAASGRLLGKTPRYSLATDKQIYTIGERVTIDARIFDANMEPSKDPTTTVYHRVKGRDFEPPSAIELQLNPAREAGAYEGAITASQLGSHDLWLGTEAEPVAFLSFTVEVPPLEFRDPRLARERMKKVARLAEGKYYDLHGVRSIGEYLVERAQPRKIPVAERQDDLWDEYWVLLLFTGVIAAEWVLRKLARLL